MILFVTQNTDSFNNPTIDAFLTILEEKKQHSILLCPTSRFANKFEYCEVILTNNVGLNLSEGLIKTVKKLVKNFKKIYKIRIKRQVKTIIAIDPDGLIFATRVKSTLFLKAPIDYLSFEILEEKWYPNKSKEIDASKQIRNLIIQDSLRDQFLRTENRINNHVQSFYIPVSPIFKKNYKKSLPSFREVHSISKEKKLIINFGTFDTWSGAEFIYDVLKNNKISKDYIFVIHSKFKLNPEVKIHKKILDYSMSNSNLILSNDYIDSFDDALLFLKQFDFGTVFYFPDGQLYTGNNIYNIGLASGKFSMYVKAGVVPITNNLPTYEKLNTRFNFGLVVRDSESLFRALNKEINKEEYQKNGQFLYNELLDSELAINKYLNAI